MRKLPPAVAISAAVHAAAVAWVGLRTPDAPPPPPPTLTMIELVEPVPKGVRPLFPAIEQEKGSDPFSPPLPPTRERKGVRPLFPAISVPGALTTETGAGSGSATPTTEPGAPRNPLFDMRRPKVELGLRPGRWDDLDHVPAGTTPERTIDSGQLSPSGGGTMRSDQGVFTAKVGKDGSVKLKDAKNFHIHLRLPSARDIGDAVQGWYDDPNKPVGTLPPERVVSPPRLPGDEVTSEESGAEGKMPQPGDGSTVVIAGGGFDITDALMRRKGTDPYAAKKLRFLDATRAERVQIGTRYRTQQLGQATQIMQRNLDRLWSRLEDPATRKQGLFELWDECAETGTAELVTAGREARSLVVGFIRARLPAGSDTAYTADELAAFNRRKQSSATFAPYQ